MNVADCGIYRAYDEQDRLLYVGMTSSLRARFRQHFAESAWISSMGRLEFETGYTEEEARVEEERLIRELRPLYNTVFAVPERTERTEPLSVKERRELVLAALAKDPETGKAKAQKTELARRYGIVRGHVYRLIEEATADPEARLREAEEEVEFRRRVLELLDEE